jgi:hypothetical protein
LIAWIKWPPDFPVGEYESINKLVGPLSACGLIETYFSRTIATTKIVGNSGNRQRVLITRPGSRWNSINSDSALCGSLNRNVLLKTDRDMFRRTCGINEAPDQSWTSDAIDRSVLDQLRRLGLCRFVKAPTIQRSYSCKRSRQSASTLQSQSSRSMVIAQNLTQAHGIDSDSANLFCTSITKRFLFC